MEGMAATAAHQMSALVITTKLVKASPFFRKWNVISFAMFIAVIVIIAVVVKKWGTLRCCQALLPDNETKPDPPALPVPKTPPMKKRPAKA